MAEKIIIIHPSCVKADLHKLNQNVGLGFRFPTEQQCIVALGLISQVILNARKLIRVNQASLTLG